MWPIISSLPATGCCWMPTYGSIIYGLHSPTSKKARIYSQALHRILKAQSRLYIDVLVTSEFINAFARIRWRQLANGKTRYKQFRNSHGFQAVAQDIAVHIESVIRQCELMESGFITVDVTSILADFRQGKADFNDLVLAGLCRQNNLALMTDDGDFTQKGLKILTANRRLLQGS